MKYVITDKSLKEACKDLYDRGWYIVADALKILCVPQEDEWVLSLLDDCTGDRYAKGKYQLVRYENMFWGLYPFDAPSRSEGTILASIASTINTAEAQKWADAEIFACGLRCKR